MATFCDFEDRLTGYASYIDEPDNIGTAGHRTACAQVCLRAGLPCPLLDAW